MEADIDPSLHRSGKRPDWEKIPRRRWNIWQRVAHETGGTLTIGNVLTAIGFVMVLAGLVAIIKEAYWHGLWLVIVGRICDILDGWSAHQTRTKSPFGELFDSTADKLETAAALIVLTLTSVFPPWAAALVFIPQLAIATLTGIRLRSGRRLHPSRLGKFAMAAAWLGIGVFILAAASPSDLVTSLGYALCGASAILSLVSLQAYYRSE